MLVQLSGVPGSGKSTLARAVAASTGFVVVDTDVLKSSVIGSGVPVAAAGAVAYATALALTRDLLEQGRSVVLDSPCRYRSLLDSGSTTAADCGTRYAFIELWVTEWTVVLDRLDTRTARPSQVASATEPVPGTSWEHGTPEATLRAWQEQLVRPETGCLRLAAESPAEHNVAAALGHLASDRRPATSEPRLGHAGLDRD